MPTNLENSAVATGLEKVNFHSNPKERQSVPENVQITIQLHSFHNLARLCSKSFNPTASAIHKPRTSRCINWTQQRQRNQRSNCQHPLDLRKSKGIPENINFCFIDYGKAFDCVDHNKLWKILKDMGIQTILPVSRETYMQDQRQQLGLNIEQWTGQNWGKSTSRLYIVTLLT